MQDLQALEKLGGLSQVTQIMPADGDSGQASNTEEFGLQVGFRANFYKNSLSQDFSHRKSGFDYVM